MTKIMFRGRQIKTGQWIYGFYWHIEEHQDPFFSGRHFIKSKNNGIDFEINPTTVGQYTGFDCQDSKEPIYTGDRVSWGTETLDNGQIIKADTGVVFFDDIAGSYKVRVDNNNLIIRIPLVNLRFAGLRVIPEPGTWIPMEER